MTYLTEERLKFSDPARVERKNQEIRMNTIDAIRFVTRELKDELTPEQLDQVSGGRRPRDTNNGPAAAKDYFAHGDIQAGMRALAGSN